MTDDKIDYKALYQITEEELARTQMRALWMAVFSFAVGFGICHFLHL